MRVLNHLEFESHLDRSGMGTSVDQQRAALARTDVSVVTSPWNDDSPIQALKHGLGRNSDRATGVRDSEEPRENSTNGFFASIDLVHCNMAGPVSIALARYANYRDVPLVLHAHLTREDFAESFRGSTAVSTPLGWYLRWFYSQADLVLCPSQYTKRVLESYPVDAPIRPISNGVDIDALSGYENFRDEYRTRYDLDGLVVFALGNVFERKGLTTFCELAQATDYEFAWFGPYDTGPQASSTVRRWTNNPPENVTFTGWIDDRRGAFAAGDIYLFPAKVENQGLVVLEAMACGKAVILRDIPVFQEYYTHGEDCLMCETHDEFRDALDELAENPSLRQRLGENARETAADHSLDRVADELLDAYNEVITI